MTTEIGYQLHGNSIIINQAAAATIICMLVQKLGGKVTLTQEDFDAIVGTGLGELVEGTNVTFSVEVFNSIGQELH